MKISVLGSGSAGNSTYIEVDGLKILVDAGFSCKKIEEKLEQIGEKLSNISAMLITHEHTDHINGAGIVARKYDIPLYISRESYEAGATKLGELDRTLLKFIDTKEFILGDTIKISPFDVMHDAERTLGFRIESQLGKKIAISTDIGYIDNIVREYFKDVDAMIIESNYDYNMLMNCSYPWNLKARVKSRNGHLSNNDCARFIKEMHNDKMKKIFLAHISKDSNDPMLIKQTMDDEFDRMLRRPEYEITNQDIVSKLIEI
ncbi:MAG: MBL fold metallo-hydrolase [Fusobacterium gastrosuis]|uniref:MBL fold metallo-hydrolase n=1 Tax=Fusobacterium TaxID=848 RepID=UPI001F501816|nr:MULTISPECIES: MBL fold metallo-hydrolase [Fusobacterium]MDD7410544.1 MBL fold metallo-hydrolase [Fusobacteriaceae bacterium]MCI7224219.1 MBL fold metallo-hydrolase [Fusobacterium sp.]MDY4010350.1 MBL fold metallo-hydrolase [Fusobacterium gastrosuis]MDY5305915.1 MBL fold metallo-hydrolase [Fusobacterium gastrosuis]MDY5713273.1 MBL fold metallo-hydrolase [Fusobacterium gastrosuis]